MIIEEKSKEIKIIEEDNGNDYNDMQRKKIGESTAALDSANYHVCTQLTHTHMKMIVFISFLFD